MGPSELFSFTDENIPKIENIQLDESVAKKSNKDFDIDNIENIKITPELIQILHNKIHNNEFSDEEKTKILAVLKKNLNGTLHH